MNINLHEFMSIYGAKNYQNLKQFVCTADFNIS
jgi:hypothetical protein